MNYREIGPYRTVWFQRCNHVMYRMVPPSHRELTVVGAVAKFITEVSV